MAIRRPNAGARFALTGLPVWAAFAFAAPQLAFADEEQPLAPNTSREHKGADGRPSPSSTTSDTEEDRTFALRLQHRLSGRLSIDLNLGFDVFKHADVSSPFPAARILFGYRKNVAPSLGYHLRVGPMLGIPRRSSSGDSGPGGAKVDTSLLMGASAEGVFVFGPYGRFFVGPLICVDYVHFSNTTLHNVYPTVYLHNGFTAGGGVDIGGVFGSREQMIVYQSVRITDGPGEALMFLLYGIGSLW